MEFNKIEDGAQAVDTSQAEDLAIAGLITEAAHGCIESLFNLGVAYSTGSQGVTCDLIEAHKWFNLAAAKGHDEAAWCRADISEEMTAREIAEAQRMAREWLVEGTSKAA